MRILPQRKLTMIDLDIKGGAKARQFWSNEDAAELAELDCMIIRSTMQTVTDLMPGHPAQAVCANVSDESLDMPAVQTALRELASLSAGSHLRVVVVVASTSQDPSLLEHYRLQIPIPLELGLSIRDARDWLPDDLATMDIRTVKWPATLALPTHVELELDRSLCLRIDGYAARGVDLVITSIDRKNTLLNLLDYPVRLGQGAELGSQTVKVDRSQLGAG